ncbi:MCE family protein [Rhodobacteraceae bacterium 2376]|uniref:MCE family protein n=1 Tax=Rhabdonatronobacter sediminivivens TaxID=2743469 RepID=A0A7Z0HYG3_9RHOB|nr:MlaD family protein [Rhabdonatronobacter sediminivivens]NYS24582.1 MCE family protein [Rhabdonatronobacter sediminivivens]
METRANYVLIGAFALAGFLGLLIFLMVFANVQLDRRYTYFDVRFPSVSGLSRASEVRFEGLPVGQVVDVRLSPEMDGTITVRLEVDEDTPVRTDSTATISTLGVTGVSIVALSAGTPDQPMLRDTAEIPVIEAGRSTLDAVFEDGPAVLAMALEVVENLNELLGETNRNRVENILDNLERSSVGLATALDDFAEVSQTIATASTDIAEFTTRMVPVAEAALGTLGRVDLTLETYGDLARRAVTSLDVGDAALEAATQTLQTADSYMAQELPDLTRELTETSTALRNQIDMLGADTRLMLANFGDVGAEATARLREAEAAIASFEDLTARLAPVADSAVVTLANVDATLETYGALAGQAGSALDGAEATFESARLALDTVEQFMAGDLPVLTRDLTQTSATLRQQATVLGADAQRLMTGFTEVGEQASARLSEAQETIARTDLMLLRLTETLNTVDTAAGRFDGLMADEAAPLLADARAMIASATEAVEAVTRATSDDLPAVMADIRTAARTATEMVETVGADLSAASGRLDGVLETTQGTMTQVGETFANANTTLEAINSALDIGERTLAAAERAFAGADRVINEEVSGVLEDLRAAMRSLDGAIAQVSDDIPAVTASLRESAETANEAFAELGRVIATSGPAVREFATQALPQYTQIGRETRAMISNLERLLRQIERDPARFFLGRQTPEFRR